MAKSSDKNLDLSAVDRASVLLVTMEREVPGITSRIFNHIGEDKAKIMLKSIANLGRIEADTVNATLKEFYDMAIEQKIIYGGKDISQKILRESFGVEEGDAFFAETRKLFGFMEELTDKDMRRYFQDENAQITALILSNLSDDRVASILSKLPIEQSQAISKKMLELNVPSQALVWKLHHHLEERFFGDKVEKESSEMARLQKLARILEMMESSSRKKIMALLGEGNPDIANAFNALIFSFDDLEHIDNKDLENILYEVDPLKDLAIAISQSSPEFLERVKTNISDRVQIMLEEELNMLPESIEKETVEKAQQKMIQLARRLEKEGRISKLQSQKQKELSRT